MRNTGIGIGCGYPGGVPASSFPNVYSVYFDGLGGYVEAGDVLDFDRLDPFSVSCWVKMTAGGYVVAKQWGWGLGYLGWAIYVHITGVIDFQLTQSVPTSFIGTLSAANNAGDGSWHHLAVTYSGSSAASGVCCYVDGVSKICTPYGDCLSGSTLSTMTLQIGRSGSGGGMTGNIDEVSVYGKALTPAEVLWMCSAGSPHDLFDPSAPSNLLAWWRMGDGDTWPVIRDVGPNGYDASMLTMAVGDIVADVP